MKKRFAIKTDEPNPKCRRGTLDAFIFGLTSLIGVCGLTAFADDNSSHPAYFDETKVTTLFAFDDVSIPSQPTSNADSMVWYLA